MARDLTALLYVPEPLSGEVSADYVFRELSRISNAVNLLSQGYCLVLAVEPLRPEDGMIVVADGVNWDPGAGAGAYERNAGVWVKL